MKNYSKLSTGIKLALCAASLGAYSGLSYAAEEGVEEVERIQVTGSRIRSAEAMSASPIQVLDGASIDKSGTLNLQDLLMENPTFGTPAISRTNSNFSTSSGGVATVDLRNLGTARTLVLVNGRRYVSGVPGSSAVDLNTIPAQFVERVEIMTGGASSVYGSDAVAGVVNFVLKDDFEGIEFEGQYGESAEGDNTEKQFSVTTGTTTSDGAGQVMFHLGYSDQGAVYSRDRDISAVDQISAIYFNDPYENPGSIFEYVRPYYSSFSPQGRFDAGDTRFTFDENNNLKEGFDTNGDNGPADGFNRSGRRTIAIPTERYLFASNGSYELDDNHKFFYEATYAATTSVTELEPFPFASDDIYSNGRVPIEFMRNGELLRNPYVPDAIYNSATDTDGDGMRDIFFAKRLADIGNRGYQADRDTFRFTTGFEGQISDNWYYDAYYIYGKTKENQVSNGLVNVQNFRYALEAVTDTQDLDGDGITDEAICLDETARGFGCTPINVFGFNSITSDAFDYVKAPSMLSTRVEQEIIGANFTGELFELPAGYVGVAFGAEYREEFSRSEFDALQQAGLNAGNAIPATEGEFDVTEYYVEANVPVLDSLSLKAAVRLSDYSTVGNTESWNVGLDWTVVDGVRVRATRARSTRAPNIDELYSPPSQTFPSDLIDPCNGVTASSSGAAADACRADAGVAANIAENGEFTLNQSDIQGISGFNRGNTELTEEVGDSFTVGIVLTPENIISGLDITIDYFDIEIEDAIVSTPRQFILDQCYGGGDTSFCDFITRRPTNAGNNSAGSIEFIDSGQSNSGGTATEGVDLTATYSTDLGPGMFKSRLAYTYLIDGYDIPLPGADKDNWAGEIGYSEHKANWTFGYDVDDFSFNWSMTYIGAADFDDQFLAGLVSDSAPDGLPAGYIGIGSEVYHDIQLSYYITEQYELYGGVDNLLDNEAPRILTGISGNDTGTETDAGTYDPIGQRFYVGIRAKF
ncbi:MULTISPECIES: TonB-dependent receptor domain-containing protein [Pseudoalteromonas]|uniref:TonB-dependent receptor n=1 Tax=Pseudoalteromonas ruthenica TaxID=151081 RepID=A0A0F4PTR4_9GAMM|nr:MULTISPECIES: TonB-dependent receptor [Pseudoalteromonas]KJY95147.1 TonB-dependent receptor [Pseudoalteromonas ruthenica]KJY98827.1 TonB-dependent receptor [Pseudoalteromonas ruthenica]MCG7543863.1 TonB-dependent receptor [Pseudoalteromonas sp. MM17-2]RZF79029.1 TonB-dependent receptor [Pseudoalteromonas sp. CO325X]TMO85998.1 TonB-dependent receptor [Pseudoalteromonas ruthenica]|tara:strand:- start:82269 stop:85205 length:2937 start_codon:yes stop_codon:yes gene_type:complete